MSPIYELDCFIFQPKKGVPNGVRVFATITRKLSQLPKDASSPQYLGLEVIIGTLERKCYISLEVHSDTSHCFLYFDRFYSELYRNHYRLPWVPL